MSRQGLYVGATRGREANMMHVVTEQLLGLGEGELPPARTAEEVLARVVERDARERSATEILRAGLDRLGPEEITRLREERGRLQARLDGPDVPVEPTGIELERAQTALAAAQRRVAELAAGTAVHGRFGRTKTVIDADALTEARQAVSARTRDVEDVTARGQRWRDWREDTRADRALAHDVDVALRAGTADGRDDRSLDLARERDADRTGLEYGGF